MDFAFTFLDGVLFLAFLSAVICVGMWKGREEKDSESYFLAGRGLSWWIIGISLIAANISSEQFIGMNGSAASPVGLAIASYAWMAPVALVIIAFTFLPMFLKAGVYTIPEYLEYRYHPVARTFMAVSILFIYVFITISAVTYSGGLIMETLFHEQLLFGQRVSLGFCCTVMVVIAALYVTCGGLKACAWADLLQGGALILGGFAVCWLAFAHLGKAPLEQLTPGGELVAALDPTASGVTRFFALNREKLHLFLPRSNPDMPWTALLFGLWIPQFYYWGLNQFIVQKTLASRSLAEGQKGVLLAGTIHMLSPLFIVVPGLIAFNLFSREMSEAAAADGQITQVNQAVLEQWAAETARAQPETLFEMDRGWTGRNLETAGQIALHNDRVRQSKPDGGAKVQQLTGYKYDLAFPLLVRKLVPSGLRGFILAALLGAIVSSLAAMLNSASSIFTMDIYKKYVAPAATERQLVTTGRLFVVAASLLACWIAPTLSNPAFGGIFKYMQLFQGYISPGVLAAFIFGFCVKKAPPITGIFALLGGPLIYGILHLVASSIPFLDRMAITFALVIVLMGVITAIKPLPQPIRMPVSTAIDLTPSKGAKWFGAAIIAIMVFVYVIFR